MYEEINKKQNKTTTITFTDDQKAAIDNITAFLNKEFDSNNFIIGLTGAGGTGKTFITNYIIANCKYSSSVIKCTSSTHKACRVFSQALNNRKVETIQSTLGLRLDLKLEDFNPEQPQFNPTAQPKLDNIKLLIVDEASMLPAKLVTYIIKICKDLQIKIIFIGDSYQLSPVNEFRSIAFDRCGKVCELNEIVRQGESNPSMFLLDLLRQDIKNKTFKFIEYVSRHIGEMNYNELQEGYSIVGPNGFKNFIDLCFKDEAYKNNIDMYRIIAYTNAKVSFWNNYIRSTIINDADKGIINKDDLIMSYETIVDNFNDIIINNSEEYIIHSIINYVDDKYTLNRCPIMLKGFLIQFQLIHGGNITKPIFVVDHTDIDSIRGYLGVINELKQRALNATRANRVERWKDYYNFKKEHLIATNIIDRYTGKINYSRDLDYGFAITSHKSQGSTYDMVFVDLNDMIYDKNLCVYRNIDDLLRRLYVACSRAKTNLILCYGNKG